MKKSICLILVTLLVMSIASCGTDSNGNLKKPSNVFGDTSTNESTSDGGGETEDNAQPSETGGSSTEYTERDASIEETVLLDEAGVKITAKSISIDGLFGPEIKLLIENDSGTNLTFQCRYSCVNGYMIENMMSVDVADGKKANDSITLSSSGLGACGISNIADIELAFHIFTSSDWETYLDTDLIKLTTSIADGYEYKFDDSGDVAYNKDNVKIVVKGLSEDSIFGPSVVVFIENNTDKDLTVQVRDVSINDFMVDAMFSCDVLVGKRAVDTITFLSSELEENEITTIETIELSFHIFDAHTWSDIANSESVTITF